MASRPIADRSASLPDAGARGGLVRLYTLAGIAAGLVFPVVGTMLSIGLSQLPLTLESARQVQGDQPLLWIIDLAPLILGGLAFALGSRQRALAEAEDRVRRLSETLQAQRTEADRALRDRTDRLQAQADVSRAVSSILDPDRLMYQVVSLISDRLGYHYVALFTLDEDGKYAVLREATSEAGRAQLARGHRLPVGDGSMVGVAIATRAPRIAQESGDEPLPLANPLLPKTRSEMALPLIAGDRVLGALDVQSLQPAAFDAMTASLLQGMADHVAVALNNAQLYTDSQRSVHMLDGLLEMTRDLAASRTLQDLTRRARTHLESILGVDTYYLALVDEQQTEIRFILQRRSDGRVQDEVIAQPFGGGPGLVEQVVRTRRPLRINASSAPARLAQLSLGTSPLKPRAYLGVPIVVGARVLGALGMQDFRLDATFGDFHERVAVAMANQLGMVLENLRLAEQTRRALADMEAANRVLTGRAWQRATRESGPLAGEWRGGQWLPVDGRRFEAPIDLPGQLKLPLRVRGETVGEIDVLPAGDETAWSPEDVAFAQSLVDQVGQTLETVRLLEETERLAGRERLINEINSRVRQTVNIDSILQTAVGELGRTLGAARVFARVGGSMPPLSGGDTTPLGDARADDPGAAGTAGSRREQTP